MLLIPIHDFDKEVQKRIRFSQDKYNCVIFVKKDENGNYFMDVHFVNGLVFTDIFLSEGDGSKYKLMSAMRNWFIEKTGV